MRTAQPTSRRSVPRGAGVLTAVLLLTACVAEPEADPTTVPSPEAAEPAEGTDEAAPEEPQDADFTIVSAGDVLIHDNVIDTAAELAGDPSGEAGYDFFSLMSGVQEWIAGADLALCSMEVPITPEDIEPAGYPVFGAPEEIVPALKQLGFHGCNTANNHSVDRGTAGLTHTLEVFDNHDLGHVGTARTEEEAGQAQLYTLERGGREITVAHLSTTMIHNDAYPPPADAPWMVTDVSAEELTQMAADVRADGADIVLASVHWGTEYVHEPTPEQRQYGEALAAAGEIDVVYGNHSHTPQPIEELPGGPDGQGMWVVWSMGNFIHNQDNACCVPESATGTMVYATVEVPEGDPPAVSGLEWAPVTVDRGPTDDDGHRGIWPLAELIDEGIPEQLDLDEQTVETRWARVSEVMGEEWLRTEPPEPTGEDPVVVPGD